MHAPQPMSPRARLQELLAIPESQRTDAQWDEIHELEIKLSSANRAQHLEQDARRDTPANAAGHCGKQFASVRSSLPLTGQKRSLGDVAQISRNRSFD